MTPSCEKCDAEAGKCTHACREGEDSSTQAPNADGMVPPPPVVTPPERKRNVAQDVVVFVIGLFVLYYLGICLGIIPCMQSSRKAREASLVANLHMIRNAVDAFHSDTGHFPKTLVVLTKDRKSIKLSDFQGKLSAIPRKYNGPYLTVQGGVENLPTNPFANSKATTIKGHWDYDPVTGKVKCHIGPAVDYPADTTLDGIRWTDL